jgi:hypothetical protein
MTRASTRATVADYFRRHAEEGAGHVTVQDRVVTCTFRVLPADVEHFPELAGLYAVSILAPKSRNAAAPRAR